MKWLRSYPSRKRLSRHLPIMTSPPHGFNDIYDALQMYCSNNTLGIGIGNVDRNYPLFGIPTLRF